MDFKEMLRTELDEKYVDMLDTSIGSPFEQKIAVDNQDIYRVNRNDYFRRLHSELNEFNNSIDTIVQRRTARLEEEERLRIAKIRARETRKKRIIITSLVIVSLVSMALGVISAINYYHAAGAGIAWVVIFLLLPTVVTAAVAYYHFSQDKKALGFFGFILPLLIINIIVLSCATGRYSYTDNGLYVKHELNGSYTVSNIVDDYEEDSITIPDNISKLSKNFGKHLQVEKLYFASPNENLKIGKGAFKDNQYLEEIVLPEGTTSIDNQAFSGCSNLTRIVIPSSVTSIGYDAFYGCRNLIIYCGAKNAPSDWSSRWNCYSSGSYCPVIWDCKNVGITTSEGIKWKLTTSNNISIIGFSGNQTTLVIPNSIDGHKVTQIDSGAFVGCNKLKSVTIPSSVTSIGSAAFSGCSSLTNITLPFVGGSASATSASSSTLFGYIFGSDSYTGGVSTRQYYSNNSYVTYYIPSSLKSITVTGGKILYGAFFNCSNIITIELPRNIVNIGDYAFSRCTSLTNIDIPDHVNSIGDHTFTSCTSLTSIDIPDSVTSIGSSAFYNCTNLSRMTLPFVGGSASATSASANTLFGYIFGSDSYTGGVSTRQYYSNNSYVTYYIPSSLKTIIVTGNKILYGAFYNCGNITTIIIPSTVTSVGEKVFQNCSSLSICCTAEEQPTGWNSNWNPSNRPVTWGYVEIQEAVVSFNLNGGTGVTPVNQIVTMIKGMEYPAIPIRSGYLFAGWYDNSECAGDAFDFSAYVKGNITLYAKWVEYNGADILNINQNETVFVVSKESPNKRYYAFVPLVDGVITIYTEGSLDTYGYLYNASKSQLAYDDDSGSENNFKITYNVTAGTLYYISPCGYDSSGSTIIYLEGQLPRDGGTILFVG